MAQDLMEITFIDVYVPEQMPPGTLFFLEHNEGKPLGSNPLYAILACPRCGTLGLINQLQCIGDQIIICGSDECSAAYYIRNNAIEFVKTH